MLIAREAKPQKSDGKFVFRINRNIFRFESFLNSLTLCVAMKGDFQPNQLTIFDNWPHARQKGEI